MFSKSGYSNFKSLSTKAVCVYLQAHDCVETEESNLTDFSPSPKLWILNFHTWGFHPITCAYISALTTIRGGFYSISTAYHFYFHCSKCEHIICIDVCVNGMLIGCYALDMCLWRWRLHVMIFYMFRYSCYQFRILISNICIIFVLNESFLYVQKS